MEFKNFQYALEIIGVTFQQSNRTSRNIKKGKPYYSDRHNLYGCKVEVWVRPNGISSAFSKNYPGSVSDLAILHGRISVFSSKLKKHSDEEDFNDDFSLSGKYQQQCYAITDKGYERAAEVLSVITPHKKLPKGPLRQQEEKFNKSLSSDRIIVENYSGLLGQLWTILSNMYVWLENIYDMIFGLCVSFTNYHVSSHGPRDMDGKQYNRVRNRLMHTSNAIKGKRADDQSKYRKKRKLRL